MILVSEKIANQVSPLLEILGYEKEESILKNCFEFFISGQAILRPEESESVEEVLDYLRYKNLNLADYTFSIKVANLEHAESLLKIMDKHEGVKWSSGVAPSQFTPDDDVGCLDLKKGELTYETISYRPSFPEIPSHFFTRIFGSKTPEPTNAQYKEYKTKSIRKIGPIHRIRTLNKTQFKHACEMLCLLGYTKHEEWSLDENGYVCTTPDGKFFGRRKQDPGNEFYNELTSWTFGEFVDAYRSEFEEARDRFKKGSTYTLADLTKVETMDIKNMNITTKIFGVNTNFVDQIKGILSLIGLEPYENPTVFYSHTSCSMFAVPGSTGGALINLTKKDVYKLFIANKPDIEKTSFRIKIGNSNHLNAILKEMDNCPITWMSGSRPSDHKILKDDIEKVTNLLCNSGILTYSTKSEKDRRFEEPVLPSDLFFKAYGSNTADKPEVNPRVFKPGHVIRIDDWKKEHQFVIAIFNELGYKCTPLDYLYSSTSKKNVKGIYAKQTARETLPVRHLGHFKEDEIWTLKQIKEAYPDVYKAAKRKEFEKVYGGIIPTLNAPFYIKLTNPEEESHKAIEILKEMGFKYSNPKFFAYNYLLVGKNKKIYEYISHYSDAPVYTFKELYEIHTKQSNMRIGKEILPFCIRITDWDNQSKLVLNILKQLGYKRSDKELQSEFFSPPYDYIEVNKKGYIFGTSLKFGNYKLYTLKEFMDKYKSIILPSIQRVDHLPEQEDRSSLDQIKEVLRDVPSLETLNIKSFNSLFKIKIK